MSGDVWERLDDAYERSLRTSEEYERRQPEWLTHLVDLAEALETGSELPESPWERPKLTLIRGGRDA